MQDLEGKYCPFEEVPLLDDLGDTVQACLEINVTCITESITVQQIIGIIGDARSSLPNGGHSLLFPSEMEPQVRLAQDAMMTATNADSLLDGAKSASRRAGRVTITVVGNNRTVNEWTTDSFQYPSDGCIIPRAYWNQRYPNGGGTYQFDTRQFGTICFQAPPGQTYYHHAWTGRVPRTFNRDFDACNQWTPSALSGYPCVGVFQR